MRRLLACLVLAALAAPAAACINDSELPKHEREFRSQYLKPVSPPEPPANSSDPYNYQLLFGAGAALLTGATVVAITGRRARG